MIEIQCLFQKWSDEHVVQSYLRCHSRVTALRKHLNPYCRGLIFAVDGEIDMILPGLERFHCEMGIRPVISCNLIDAYAAYISQGIVSTECMRDKDAIEAAGDSPRQFRLFKKLLPKSWRDGALGDLMEDIASWKRDGIPRLKIGLMVLVQLGVLSFCALMRWVAKHYLEW